MPSGGPLVRVKTHRDKHGGETILLTQGGENGPPTVIYAHRTIPGLRLARHPFDEETIQLLEHLYPQLEFDWPRILRTIVAPVGPPPEIAPSGRGPRGRAPEETVAAAPRGSDRPRQPQGRDEGSRSRAPRSSGRRADAIQVAEAVVGSHTSASAEFVDDAVVNGGAHEDRQGAPAGDPPTSSPEASVFSSSSARPAENGDAGGELGLMAGNGVPSPLRPSVVDQPALVPGFADTAQELGEAGDDEDAEGEGRAADGRTVDGAPVKGFSIGERYGSLVQRIHQRVRDPLTRAAMLAEAAALEPTQWSEPLAPTDAERFERLFEAVRKQLPSRRRRRRRRGGHGGAPGSPSSADGAGTGGATSDG